MAGSPFPEKGIRFQWVKRPWIEPVSKPWFWFRINQWFGQTDKTLWFTWRTMKRSWPFLSWNVRGYHGYLGWKTYGMMPTGKDAEYGVWLPKDIQERQQTTGLEEEAVTLTIRGGRSK